VQRTEEQGAWGFKSPESGGEKKGRAAKNEKTAVRWQGSTEQQN